MRLLATIPEQTKAEALVAYLLTRQISTHVEPGGPSDQWEVWIRDEDRLDEAREELERFLKSPDDPKYRQAVREAQQIVQEKRKQRAEAVKNLKTGRTIFRGGITQSGGIPPITLTLIILGAVVSLATNFMDPGEGNDFGVRTLDTLSFLSQKDFREHPDDPAASLKKGELWRIITPIFPHGSPIHLLFNVLLMIQLGRIVERMEGSFRYALLALVTAIVSNLMQGLVPEKYFGYPFFGGLSGIVYGVFGFLILKTSLRPELGIRLSQMSIAIMLGWLVLGFTGKLGGIANLAHLGGLLAGVVLAYVDVFQARIQRKR